MKKISILLFVSLTFAFSAKSQLSTVEGQTDYNFWINLPADSILQNNPPVLIFLHGRSLSGSNLELVKKYGIIKEIERGRNIPAIVIAPQVPAGKSWEPQKVLNVLQYVQAHYQTDTNRVYVAGMSLGGYGTLHFAGAYPHVVTAAVALCGGGNPSDGCDLATVPLWIQHGESEKIVKAIKSCNGGENLIYTRLPSADHGDLERIFRTDELYNWLFQFSKTVQE